MKILLSNIYDMQQLPAKFHEFWSFILGISNFGEKDDFERNFGVNN